MRYSFDNETDKYLKCVKVALAMKFRNYAYVLLERTIGYLGERLAANPNLKI